MTANPQTPTRVTSTGQIVDAASVWIKTGQETGEHFATLARIIEDDLCAGLIVTGVGTPDALMLTGEMQAALHSLADALHQVAKTAKDVVDVRDEMLRVVKAAKARQADAKQFRVVV